MSALKEKTCCIKDDAWQNNVGAVKGEKWHIISGPQCQNASSQQTGQVCRDGECEYTSGRDGNGGWKEQRSARWCLFPFCLLVTVHQGYSSTGSLLGQKYWSSNSQCNRYLISCSDHLKYFKAEIISAVFWNKYFTKCCFVQHLVIFFSSFFWTLYPPLMLRSARFKRHSLLFNWIFPYLAL